MKIRYTFVIFYDIQRSYINLLVNEDAILLYLHEKVLKVSLSVYGHKMSLNIVLNIKMLASIVSKSRMYYSLKSYRRTDISNSTVTLVSFILGLLLYLVIFIPC